MRCRQCGLDNSASSRFCSDCGTRLDVCCPRCKQLCPAEATFCSWCGSMLHQLSGPRADGGERKQATVLFADIVESTELIAGLDAEEAVSRLHPVLAAMSRAARQFGGTIVRSLGDGLKITFGAPRAQEGHAVLACRAALAIQEAVRALDNAPAIRVGLHSGEVVAGVIDTGSAIEQEAQGLTVHIASRIQQLAPPGCICITEDCYQLVRAFCDTVPMQKHRIRGLLKPIPVHELTGLRPAVASEQFRNAELTPFQGRDAELAMLDHALAEALCGAPEVIGIAAPAGVGKSRLCFEFGERCRRQSIYVLEARCFIHGQTTPMLPIIEMLCAYFRVSPLDQAEDVRGKLEDKLGYLDPALLKEVDLLFGLLGVRDPSDPVQATDPSEAQKRLCGVFAGMIKAAGRQPGVIIFEDLHWLDPASANLLNAMLEASADTQILMVLNFRPAFRAPWMETPRYRQIALRELERSEMDALVRDLVGSAAELIPLRAQIATQCDGNPFFAEELVRSLAEVDVLAGSKGRYRLGAAAPGAVLPATVESVVGARIDRLPESAKALLQVGATIGKEFPLALLSEIAVVPQNEIEPLLTELCESELIQERTSMLGRGFGFRHPLIQEVAYRMQLRTRRRQLHAEVAKAMESLRWAELDELAGDLAHHHEVAGDMLAAATHLRRSALWVGRTDTALALRQWKRVHALLDAAPRAAEHEALRMEACGAVLTIGWREGMSASEASAYAQEGLRLARNSGDPLQGPLLLISYGRIIASGGRADDYVELCREALALHGNDPNRSLGALLHGTHAQSLVRAGLLREALATIEAGTELLRTCRFSEAHEEQATYIRGRAGFDPGQWLRALRTLVLVWLGRFGEAGAAIAETGKYESDATVQFIPHMAGTDMAYWREDPVAGSHHATAISEQAERSQLPYMRVMALIGLGKARTAERDFEGALASYDEALGYARSTRAALDFEPQLLSLITDATHRAGAIEDAVALGGAAIELAQARTHRLAECHASLVGAMALLETGLSNAGVRAEALLSHAEELIEISGAGVFEGMLAQARALLESRQIIHAR